MSTKISPLKQAVGAFEKAIGSHQYGVDGIVFVCPVCGHNHFKWGTGAKVLGSYWFACAGCGHVEPFAQQPSFSEEEAEL